MTDIKQHVTSLELSKKLKQAGVPQESCLYWQVSTINATHLTKQVTHLVADEREGNDCGIDNLKRYFSCLQPIYNDSLWINKKEWSLGNPFWDVYSAYLSTELEKWLPVEVCKANLSPNDRAKMLLYLIKEGLVDVTSLKSS